MSQHLNIVSFDVPYPANYGGVIDVYYKLVWLKKAGVKIYLHCYTYGRAPSKELEALCEQVYYYPRKTGLLSNLSLLPYNVRSRQSEALAVNLLSNDYPILFEVLHTCSLMADARFKDRKKIYRHSNIEHDYYAGLARSEKDPLKKLYLRIEAIKLRAFEKVLKFADLILTVNQNDSVYFKKNYPAAITEYIPSFHPEAEQSSLSASSDYLLFHGNLSVSENYDAAIWLIEHVFSKISSPVTIAGLNPPAQLQNKVEAYPHIRLIKSPGEHEMEQLIAQAKVHVLYTAQATGLKLKLLNVLFKGRFVLCNSAMLEGTGLAVNTSLYLAETAPEFVEKIGILMQKDFTSEMGEEREKSLNNFRNDTSIKKLLNLVFNEH